MKKGVNSWFFILNKNKNILPLTFDCTNFSYECTLMWVNNYFLYLICGWYSSQNDAVFVIYYNLDEYKILTLFILALNMYY